MQLQLIVLYFMCHFGSFASAFAEDLARALPPLELKRWYNHAFKKLNFEDRRIQAGEIEGVRLLCLNNKFPSYEFEVLQLPDKGGYRYNWKEVEILQGTVKILRKGQGKFKKDDWSKIEGIINSAEFKALPCSIPPISVGYPYTFLIEVFQPGSYRCLYRQSVYFKPNERRLKQFNSVVKALISHSGMREHKFTMPSD